MKIDPHSTRKTKTSDESTPEAASSSGSLRNESSGCPPPFLPGTHNKNNFNEGHMNLNNNNAKFRGEEDTLNGAACQVNDELGKKSNTFNKTTKAILQLFIREFDSPRLFEPILADLMPPTLEELEEPSNSDSEAKLIK